MENSERLHKGDKVYIESMYGSPYHGIVIDVLSDDNVVVKRDDQEYSKVYNLKRLTKDEE